jgi:hypothetical protein
LQTKNVAVYPVGTKVFSNQGYGILSDVQSCTTTESAASNGNITYTLEMTYPVGGVLFDKLETGNLIRAQVGLLDSEYMIFEITSIIKNNDGSINVYGDAYPYRILRMSFDDGGKFGTYASPQIALDSAKSKISDFPQDFSLICNVSGEVDMSGVTDDTVSTTSTNVTQQPKSYANLSEFIDELVSAIYGEVEFGVNYIRIYSARGVKRVGVVLRDDKNTGSIKIKADTSSIVNKIIPMLPVTSSDGTSTGETKVGTIVTSTVAHNWIDYWSGKVVSVNTQDLANSYFNRTNCDRPTMTATVDTSVIDEDLTDINLFDTLAVYSKKINYQDNLRVSSKTVDNLTGRVSSFSLGTGSASLTTTIQTEITNIKSSIKYYQYAVQSANGKNTNYYGQVDPSQLTITPQEGDKYYQDLGNKEYAMYIFENGDWVEIANTKDMNAVTDSISKKIAEVETWKEAQEQRLSQYDTDIADIKADLDKQEKDLDEAIENATSQGKDIVELKKDMAGYSLLLADTSRNAAQAVFNSKLLRVAMENAQKDISKLSFTADEFQTSFKDALGNISNISITAKRLESTFANQYTEAMTRITQTADDINLRYVKKGQVVSEINIGSEDVRISSKYIHLDGNAIIDDATITSAMIASLSADKINTGVLNAAQVSVINLDANNITANATSFVKSQWESVYGKYVTIDGTGMHVIAGSLDTWFMSLGEHFSNNGIKIGYIGWNGWVGMPDNYNGLTFNLDGGGQYMSWAARDSGNYTQTPTGKLMWFRNEWRPTGMTTSGFLFSDNVKFDGYIYGSGGSSFIRMVQLAPGGVAIVNSQGTGIAIMDNNRVLLLNKWVSINLLDVKYPYTIDGSTGTIKTWGGIS